MPPIYCMVNVPPDESSAMNCILGQCSRFRGTLKRLRQSSYKVGGDERMFTYSFSRDIASEAVKMYGRQDCIETVVGMLRHEASHHSSEDVAGTSGGHARIACSIDPHFA